MVEAYILGHRKFVNIVRTPELFGVIIVCTVLFALMLGSVFRHTGYETVPDVESLGGFFVFALGNFMFRQYVSVALLDHFIGLWVRPCPNPPPLLNFDAGPLSDHSFSNTILFGASYAVEHIGLYHTTCEL